MSNDNGPSRLAGVVERNIRSLIAHRQRDERKQTGQQRVADAITRFTGSLTFVYVHLVVFGLWIFTSCGWAPWPNFDPTFVGLATFASVEAIFLSTFVLITQNRMTRQADKRANLDLQISLLAEHEVTRLITLVKEIAEKLDVEASRNPELPELQQDVAPEKVLDLMEHSESRLHE
jgi:uncharacterized membrane protein